jgi:hypothetical protein
MQQDPRAVLIAQKIFGWVLVGENSRFKPQHRASLDRPGEMVEDWGAKGPHPRLVHPKCTGDCELSHSSECKLRELDNEALPVFLCDCSSGGHDYLPDYEHDETKLSELINRLMDNHKITIQHVRRFFPSVMLDGVMRSIEEGCSVYSVLLDLALSQYCPEIRRDWISADAERVLQNE